MCPFCLASVGLIVAGATSAGGLTALVVKLSQKKNREQGVTPNLTESTTTAQTGELAWQESETNQNTKEK